VSDCDASAGDEATAVGRYRSTASRQRTREDAAVPLPSSLVNFGYLESDQVHALVAELVPAAIARGSAPAAPPAPIGARPDIRELGDCDPARVQADAAPNEGPRPSADPLPPATPRVVTPEPETRDVSADWGSPWLWGLVLALAAICGWLLLQSP